MKKVITIETILLFAFVLTMHFCVNYWIGIKLLVDYNAVNNNEQNWEIFCRSLTNATLVTFILLSIIMSMILIAIKDLGCFKPMLAKIEAMKQARNEAKAEKAVVDKQARIAKLEKELEELKKD